MKTGATSQKGKGSGWRLAAATRLSALWSPVVRRLSLHSVMVDDPDIGHHLVAGNTDIAQALCEKWAPTFDAVPVNGAAGAVFFCDDGDARSMSTTSCPPTLALYESVIFRARHSAPGPDGLLAAAWQALPLVSASVVLAIDDEVRAGQTLSASVRPLGIKHMDMRLFAAGWNYMLQGAVSRFVSTIQGGSAKHKSIVQNLIDLDAASRRMGFPGAQVHLPTLLLLDIRAAFPSALLAFVFAMVDVGGSLRTAVAARGGVIQGCPMSATLFRFAFEPFLYALYHMVEGVGEGLGRACAGDVAGLLKRIRFPPPRLRDLSSCGALGEPCGPADEVCPHPWRQALRLGHCCFGEAVPRRHRPGVADLPGRGLRRLPRCEGRPRGRRLSMDRDLAVAHPPRCRHLLGAPLAGGGSRAPRGTSAPPSQWSTTSRRCAGLRATPRGLIFDYLLLYFIFLGRRCPRTSSCVWRSSAARARRASWPP